MAGERTVLFVCLHGAAMSRVAAAYLNHAAPSGWRAVSAGVDPADALSPTAASLLAGTGAEELLDRSPPRAIAAVAAPTRVVALGNPAIQFELASAEIWDLSYPAGSPMRDEIPAARRNTCAERWRHVSQEKVGSIVKPHSAISDGLAAGG